MQKIDRSKVIFKDYSPNQILLLPPSLEEMIDPNHPVRIVNQVVDSLDLNSLLKKYKGGGTTSYHPKMMLKIMVFGYLSNIYSSRKIAQALHRDIYFMWLSAMSYPDHNTLNRFRSERLNGVLKEIFTQVVMLLVDSGVISMNEVFLDGTKIEANANRYTFVWARSIKTNKEKIKKQIKELWSYAESVAKDELENNEPDYFEKIDEQQVKKTIETIDRALQGKDINNKVKAKISRVRKKWPEILKKYEAQERLLEGRNSYSKTDPDATFFRMKEDHLGNGQLKPAYNVQISTENQFIIGYTEHRLAADSTALKDHMESLRHQYHRLPQAVVTDSGYGSEENYEYLENNHVEAYVKYNYFHKEQSKKWKEDPYRSDNMRYNQKEDFYLCPQGKRLIFNGEVRKTNDNGYEQTIRVYQSHECKGCPVKNLCHKAKGDKRIEINRRLQEYRRKARERLISEKGIEYRRRRPADVEAVFGIIKQNKNYRKFLTRGLEKTQIEFGLIALSHNLSKLAAKN
jgi:transposase